MALFDKLDTISRYWCLFLIRRYVTNDLKYYTSGCLRHLRRSYSSQIVT